MKFHTLIDMTGQKIGWWSVIERTDPPDHIKSARKQAWWLCKCKCGTQKAILGNMLRRGGTKSCGCRCYKRNSDHANIKTKFPVHHHLKNDPIYGLWANLLKKCYSVNNSHYKNYGAKGITVCDKWRRAPNFINWAKENGWKPNSSIEINKGETVFSPSTVFFIEKGIKISNMKRLNGNQQYRDLIGKKFGMLTVVKEEVYHTKSGFKRSGFRCHCDCGGSIIVVPNALVSGRTKRCSCKGMKYVWSRDFEKCILCNLNDSRYAAKGVCFRCYQREREKVNK